MPSLNMKDSGGVWRTPTQIHMKDSAGTWRSVQQGWMKDSAGTWRQFFTSAVVTITGASISDIQVTATAVAGVRFNTGGTIDKKVFATYTQIDSGTDWIIPNSGASSGYEIYATYTGDAPTGPAMSTWHDMSVAREWLLSNPGAAPTTLNCALTVQIRYSGGAVIDSGVFNLSAQYIP